MNPINAMSGGAVARPDIKNARAGASKSKMFGMPAAAASKTTKTASADAGIANGPAAASQSPAAPVAKSLQAPPASTVDFAQQREGVGYHAHGGHASGAPTGGAAESAGPSASTDSTTAALDPLDTNGDGVVSPQERVAGDLESLMKDLSAMSGAGDSTGNNDARSAATKIKNDFGSFVDSVLKQYAQTASASASGYSSGVAATA